MVEIQMTCVDLYQKGFIFSVLAKLNSTEHITSLLTLESFRRFSGLVLTEVYEFVECPSLKHFDKSTGQAKSNHLQANASVNNDNSVIQKKKNSKKFMCASSTAEQSVQNSSDMYAAKLNERGHKKFAH